MKGKPAQHTDAFPKTVGAKASVRLPSADISLSRRWHFAVQALGSVLLVIGCGCRVAVPEKKPEAEVHREEDVAASGEQIRLLMRSLVDPFCGEIVTAADRIIAESSDPTVKRHALLWKTEAVPAVREALFQPDQLTALMDSWVLFHQMADFFEKGPGRKALGDAHALAVTACRNLEEEMTRRAASLAVSGDVSTARAFARKWAAEHPILDSIAARESTLSRQMERNSFQGLSAMEAVGTITVTIDDLNRRLEVYSDQLVRQARWETELLVSDLAAEYQLDRAMPLAERAVTSAERAVATVERLSPSIERAIAVAEQAPELVAAERKATVVALHDERVGALQELHDAMTEERKSLTQDAERISLSLVDHAFWRAAQLCAALVAGLALLVLVGAVVLKRLLLPSQAKP